MNIQDQNAILISEINIMLEELRKAGHVVDAFQVVIDRAANDASEVTNQDLKDLKRDVRDILRSAGGMR